MMEKLKGLHLIAGDDGCSGAGCGGGRCPQVFVNKDGDFIIQGFRVSPTLQNELNPSQNEEVVRLPRHVVQKLYENYQPK